ncbi:unnamed protein product [Scytosiphon promiscuus]
MFRSSSLDNARPGITGSVSRAAAAGPAVAAETEPKNGGQTGPLISLTLLALITNLCQAALPLTSFAYAGRLTDASALAGLGLGFSVCNITGVCVYYGMGTGIEVLCSQAFGAEQYRLVGVTFARGTLLTALAFIPVAILWFEMESILLAIGQQANVAHVTGEFSRAYIWGMIPFAVFENLKRCLQAQEEAAAAMVVGILGAVVNVAFHHTTMVVFRMGVYGVGLALSLTGLFMLLALVFSTWAWRLGANGCWSGLCSPDVFKHWDEYLKECGPGLMGVFIEWTSWEATVFFAGLVGEQQLATQVMVLSAYGIVFQFSLAINTGVSNRVGNLLGSGDHNGARKSAWCGVRMAVAAAAISALGLGLGRSEWPRLYGAPDDVLDMIVSITPIYLTAQMIDMVQMGCTGILKGMGYQRIQAKAALGFWLVGVPSSWFLGVYLGWGLQGLWGGMAIAEGPLLLFYIYFLSTADWYRCMEDAATRVDDQSDSNLPEIVPGPLSNAGYDDDSDASSAGGAAADAPTPWRGAAEGRGDEEGGIRAYYSGSGGVAIVRGTSGGERVELPPYWKPREASPLLPMVPI